MRPILPIDSPHGYYLVGQYWPYLNKTEALHTASKYNKPVQWIFHDDVYASLDWTKQPSQSLDDLYKQRAQQIRDTYDYVIVNFSGGMDSWTVLHSFLSNGIHVDEVYTRWARAERKYRDPDPFNKHESNLGSEFEYAVVPVLDHIKKNYPRVKITIDDYSSDLEKDLAEDAILASNQYQSMPTFFRFNRKSDHEIEAERQGQRIAVVYGYDKIRCKIENNNFYAYFVDRIGGANNDPERTVEMFYWSRDFPLIPVAHAHNIKNYIKHSHSTTSKNFFNKQGFREIYQQACYPNYNVNVLQVGKPLGTALWESDNWIQEHNPRFYETWVWATQQYFTTIDARYFSFHNEKIVGFNSFYSPMYLIESNVDLPDVNWFSHIFSA